MQSVSSLELDREVSDVNDAVTPFAESEARQSGVFLIRGAERGGERRSTVAAPVKERWNVGDKLMAASGR